jgi:hypothetical protein
LEDNDPIKTQPCFGTKISWGRDWCKKTSVAFAFAKMFQFSAKLPAVFNPSFTSEKPEM